MVYMLRLLWKTMFVSCFMYDDATAFDTSASAVEN
jgi:hypothetical protein